MRCELKGERAVSGLLRSARRLHVLFCALKFVRTIPAASWSAAQQREVKSKVREDKLRKNWCIFASDIKTKSLKEINGDNAENTSALNYLL